MFEAILQPIVGVQVHDLRMRPILITAAAMLVFAPAALADVPVGQGPVDYTVQPQPAPDSCHYRTAPSGDILPDPSCTPGATNPAVTQDNLQDTICLKGYAKSIRPPASITGAEKRANALSYSYTGSLADIEYDHLIPLALGGSPNDPRNLWVEPGATPNPKDKIENRLHSFVCSGRMTLAAAQNAIAADWTICLQLARHPQPPIPARAALLTEPYTRSWRAARRTMKPCSGE